jgi:hypothetical protein
MDEQDRRVLFSGEMQLAAWGESMQSGAWVKMWIHPEDLEAFKHMKARTGKHAGQRLGVAIVQLGDDEAIVEHAPAPTPAPSPAPEAEPGSGSRPKRGELLTISVMWCKSKVFQKWASAHSGLPIEDEHDAKDWILDETGLTFKHHGAASRKHLDADPEAARLFHERIRRPFADYLRDNHLEP